MSYYERLAKIFVLINVKNEQISSFFYTNICYTMDSTFKEDCLCIEKLLTS